MKESAAATYAWEVVAMPALNGDWVADVLGFSLIAIWLALWAVAFSRRVK